jgi:hypothetical protein
MRAPIAMKTLLTISRSLVEVFACHGHMVIKFVNPFRMKGSEKSSNDSEERLA